jgi:hypothetical protein
MRATCGHNAAAPVDSRIRTVPHAAASRPDSDNRSASSGNRMIQAAFPAFLLTVLTAFLTLPRTCSLSFPAHWAVAAATGPTVTERFVSGEARSPLLSPWLCCIFESSAHLVASGSLLCNFFRKCQNGQIQVISSLSHRICTSVLLRFEC